MKTLLKIIGVLLLLVVIVAIGGVWYLTNKLPNVKPAEDITVEITPERLEHGKYMVEHVVLCTDCHSLRDFKYFSGPVPENLRGGGGEVMDQAMGLPGRLVTPNITPHGISTWSDGELIRAVRSGVNKDGKPLFPMMPYLAFRELQQEDLFSIVAYIRSLNPVDFNPDKTKLDFPMSLIVHTIPNDAPPIPDNKPMSELERGHYLVKMASCSDCHTPSVKGEPVAGMDFAGGVIFPIPGSPEVATANITPDEETGIGKWTKEDFLNKFRTYSSASAKSIPVNSGDFNTFMPWTAYSGMTDGDLGAIYTYLRTIKPVKNKVERIKSPTASK